MFYQGTRVPDVAANSVSVLRVSALRHSVPGVAILIAGIALLASPSAVLAQHGGGGGGGGGRNTTPLICVYDCPAIRGGPSAEDDLKNFRRTMAVQATDEQRAAFAKVAQYTQTASDRLKDFHESLRKVPASSPLADRATTLDQAIEQARAGNRNFLGSFSDAQKSGLQDIAKKLAKADSDLDKQIKSLDQIVQTTNPDSEPIGNTVASLDQEFASFQSEQLTIGRAMGILLPSDVQNLTFNLPKMTNSIDVA